jgi:16S rRNA (guanine527-N7)-methyltransferase
MRPDLQFELVDSMRRRTEWLTEAVRELDLSNATVTWGRAELLPARNANAVVSRAVARLDRLARWTSGLLAPGGKFLALKGANAAEELETYRAILKQVGLVSAEVIEIRQAEASTYLCRAVKRH